MRTIIILLFMSGIISRSYSQSGNNVANCQSELSALQSKRAAIDAEYDQVVNDLRNGLFCSKCNRSKTEIEKSGEGFSQHISNVKGTVVQAPTQAYEQARKNYLQKFNQWQESVNSKQKSCEGLQQQAQNDYNKQLQDNARRQQQVQQQAQQQAQEQANQQLQQAQQQLQQQLQEQQAASDAALLQQQQNFSQMVSNYSATQGQEIQQRKQDLDKMAKQGYELGQTIQGNNPDITRIAGQDWNAGSSFGDAPTFEDLMKKNNEEGPGSNNYFEQYPSLVKKVGTDEIVSQSNLSDAFKNGYKALKKYVAYGNAARDITEGKITEDVVKSYFSQTPNAIVQTIQTRSGNIAISNGNTVVGLVDKIADGEVTDQDFNNAVNSMNPLHFSPTFVKSSKPWTMKDTVVVVGGGIVLSALAVPVWLGIGAAAWYGFTR